MGKLAELLAAEKTRSGAWNQLFEDTLKKFKNPTHFFDGHSKSLSMIEDNPANKAIEDQNREEKPVTTTVYDTLQYALEIFAKAEDLQFQKNRTNLRATATVTFHGREILHDVPCDQLLGLEARLTRMRELFAQMPTLDATKHWEPANNMGAHVWQTKYPEETTKTEKQVVPIVLKDATKEHPAQVQPISKDTVVGKFTMTKRSGAVTASQKAESIKRLDELIVEIKQARQRANDTLVEPETIGRDLMALLLEPLTTAE